MSSSTITPVSRPASERQTRSGGIVRTLLATEQDYGTLVSRIALAAVIFPHGAQKVLGWFGGYGLSGTMGFFTQQMGIPAPLAALAIAAEFLGPLGLVFGLFGRVAAFGVMVTMAVAALTVHLSNGFFMNWFGAQKGEGVEFFILAIGLAMSVIIKGSGALSFDRWLATRSSQ